MPTSRKPLLLDLNMLDTPVSASLVVTLAGLYRNSVESSLRGASPTELIAVAVVAVVGSGRQVLAELVENRLQWAGPVLGVRDPLPPIAPGRMMCAGLAPRPPPRPRARTAWWLGSRPRFRDCPVTGA